MKSSPVQPPKEATEINEVTHTWLSPFYLKCRDSLFISKPNIVNSIVPVSNKWLLVA
jgi:hypothetical protein